MSAFANWPISRKLIAAFAAVIAVIAVSNAIVYDRVLLTEAAKNWRVHTTEVLDTLQDARDGMLDQETGVRGYLITGDQKFLEPYHKGIDAYAAAFQEVKDLTSDNPAQQSRLDELNELAKRWRSEIAEPLIALMAKPETREEARSLERAGAGKTLMDLIRAKVDQIDGVERDLLAKRTAVQNQAYATAYTMTLLGAAASLVIAMLMAFLLTRGITVPITRLTGAMTALGKGDTNIEVREAHRSDEIGALAAAVQVFKESIIERKRAEDALRDSEEQWKAVFENNPTMYFMVDTTGTIISVNPFGAEQLGYTVDELIGRPVQSVFYEADREAVLRNSALCFEQLGRALSWELRKVRKDGKVIWVRETARAMPMKSRHVLLIVCEDITERKRAEYLTGQVFESSPDAMCIVGRDYRYQRVNPGYERARQMPAESIIGHHITDVLGFEVFERTIKPYLDSCFAGKEVRYSEWFTFPSGRRYLAVSYTPLWLSPQQVEAALVVARDLTDHMMAAEALRAAHTELAHANRVATMGQLTASIAHEVNQPIAAAVTNAQTALRWLGAHPPDFDEARQALARIVDNGSRAAEVIGRIRALIKKAPARKDWFNINEAIMDVIALTRSEMLRHGIMLQTEFATGLPLVQGDRVQLQQVVLNLIMNAVEAVSSLSEGRRELRISTETDASRGVLVSVRDTGPGLDPTSVERVFEAFYTTKPGGMGMGLAICRSIVEAHGGRLWATPNEPRGAVFRFTLPPARDETVPADLTGQIPAA